MVIKKEKCLIKRFERFAEGSLMMDYSDVVLITKKYFFFITINIKSKLIRVLRKILKQFFKLCYFEESIMPQFVINMSAAYQI